MKVLIVGDVHGDPQFLSNIHAEARRFGVKTIVQLGDFGYNFDKNVIASISAWLNRDPEHQWFWLDGNHDEHNYIEGSILKGEFPGYPVPHFHERMFYCHRGSTTMIGDKLCMFLGGAYSIDKSRRTPHISWWPQEMIRQSDVHRALENAEGRKIDVMFTHDSPRCEYLDKWLYGQGYKTDPWSNENRAALTYVVDQVRPADLYHGHFHHRYDSVHTTPDGWKTNVHGVGANVHEATYLISHEAHYGKNFLIEEW
jgi:Icc-related predicted phosphoesterase